MSVLEKAAQERRRVQTDFPYFCANYVMIKDKDGNMIPFVLREYQLRLWKLIVALHAEGRPVRIIVLKSRQLGFSTMFQAYLLWQTIFNPYSGSLTVAHDDKSSKNLFNKIEFAYEHLPRWLYDDLEKLKNTAVRGSKLAFGSDKRTGVELESQFHVDTAGNKNIGRSMTFQRVHLSEVAFWEDIEMKMYGLLQALGKRAGTEAFLESTANGMGNYHHRLWERANSGESLWVPFFVGWTEDPDCSMPCPEGVHWTKDERELKARFKLTNDQMWWRRITIEDECGGDEELFRQEYPIEPDEAFIVSGNPYFGPKVIERTMKITEQPKKWGRIEMLNGAPAMIGSKQDGVETSASFVDDGTTHLIPGTPTPNHRNAPWWVWRDPVPGHPYAIGADVAGGTGKDFSTAHILDLHTEEYVATYQGKCDPDEFAYQLMWMGFTYNTALIAPEKNGEGRATVLKLQKDLGYPRLFFHQTAEDWSGGIQQSWGFRTTTKTRPTMLAQLASALRDRSPRLYCERTAKELGSFIRVDTVKLAEAAEGANDDLVISAAIANTSEVRAYAAVFIDMSEFQTPERKLS